MSRKIQPDKVIITRSKKFTSLEKLLGQLNQAIKDTLELRGEGIRMIFHAQNFNVVVEVYKAEKEMSHLDIHTDERPKIVLPS